MVQFPPFSCSLGYDRTTTVMLDAAEILSTEKVLTRNAQLS